MYTYNYDVYCEVYAKSQVNGLHKESCNATRS